MAVPTINAVINFSTGPSFAQAMILGTGILDTNILADSAAVIVDVSNQINYIQTSRGRNALADQFQTGQLTLRIVDQNGDFNPSNPSGPYYELLTPMKKVQISATYGATTYSLFSGFITSYVNTQPKDATEVAYTTIQAVDAFRLVQNAQISTVAGATAGDLSGTRINQILNQIDWPATMRDIDAGLTTMQADPGTARTSLSALETVATSEYGSLYVNTDGEFVFQDRSVTAGSIGGTVTTFNDDGTGIPYANANWKLDDDLIFNSAQISRAGGSPQTAINQPSIDKYFIHSYNLQDLLMQSDSVALDYARAYVASRAETQVRCYGIELDLYTSNYNAGIIAALELDFFDPVRIVTTQPGGSTLDNTLQIFGVATNITPNSFRVFFTTLEPVIDALILNNNIYGTLDYNVLSY
jgi:outer membrane lipoprotein SlyB